MCPQIDKQHILHEIQRTTGENGGRPLGRQRFFKATGIRESDWLGKYWARWSDALREVGLSPNELQHPFEENFLLTKYCSLIRELGHVPTSAELRLKATSSPEFPSHGTFEKFGSKRQLLVKIVRYCETHGGHEDILALCKPHADTQERELASDSREPDQVFGFVYLARAGRFYKVGKTNSVGRRERELAIQLPEKLQTIHAIRTDDPAGIEQYWHKRFEAKRRNGEWFELSSEDVRAFKRRKFM